MGDMKVKCCLWALMLLLHWTTWDQLLELCQREDGQGQHAQEQVGEGETAQEHLKKIICNCNQGWNLEVEEDTHVYGPPAGGGAPEKDDQAQRIADDAGQAEEGHEQGEEQGQRVQQVHNCWMIRLERVDAMCSRTCLEAMEVALRKLR
jgi:hypothetical protein